MKTTTNISSTEERKKLRQDIERIKEALRASEDDETSDEDINSDDQDDLEKLHVDSKSGKAHDSAHSRSYSQPSTSRTSLTENRSLLHSPFQPIQSERSVTGDSFLSGHTSLDEYVDQDELPVNLPTCLALDRAYQQILCENQNRIELVLLQNRERQKQLELELEESVNQKSTGNVQKAKPMTLYAKPYFKDVSGNTPPINQDVQLKKESNEVSSVGLKSNKSWSKAEKKKLTQGVKADALKRMMQPLLSKKELLCEKLNKVFKEDDKDDFRERISLIDKEIKHIKDTDESDLYGNPEDTSNIDWMKISAVDLDGARTHENCELFWKNTLHPSINVGSWTAEEDEKLQDLIEKYEMKNWMAVAKELETHRTPFQCLQRCQQKFNSEICLKEWTPEEDSLLLEVAESCRIGNVINWTQVTYYLEGHSPHNCQTRYEQITPNKTRGKWTNKEDMLLMNAIDTYGCFNWNLIATCVTGRSSNQCRDRWHDVLGDHIKRDAWSYEEDRHVFMNHSKYGNKWYLYKKDVPGRTDAMIMRRFKTLKKWKKVNALIKKQEPKVREVLMSPSRPDEVSFVSDHCLSSIPDYGSETSGTVNEELAMEPIYNDLLPTMAPVNSYLSDVLRHMQEEEEAKIKAEEEMREQDLRNGIIVPQCPRGARTKRRVCDVRRHNQLIRRTIKEKIGKMLDATGASEVQDATPNNVIDCLSACTNSQIKSRYPLTRVSDIIKMSREVEKESEIIANYITNKGKVPSHEESKKLLKHLKVTKMTVRRPYTRQRVDEVDKDIEAEIRSLLNVSVKRHSGRPRKFTGIATSHMLTPVEEKRFHEDDIKTTRRIVPLLLKALGADVGKIQAEVVSFKDKLDAQKQEKLKPNDQGSNNEADCRIASSDSVADKNIDNGVSNNAPTHISEDEASTEVQLNESESTGKLTKGKLGTKRKLAASNHGEVTNKKQKEDLEADNEQSLENDMIAETVKFVEDVLPTKSVTSFMSYAEEKSHQLEEKAYRKTSPDNVEFLMIGGAECSAGSSSLKSEVKINLPPLPPNYASLSGFRQLLLDRKSLILTADQLHFENKSDWIVVYEKGGSMSKISTSLNTYDAGYAADSDYSVIMKHPILKARETLEYKQLKARLLSMFLWPSLLSTVAVEDLSQKESKEESQAKAAMTVTVSEKKKYKVKRPPCTAGRKARKLRVKSKEDRLAQFEKRRKTIALKQLLRTTGAANKAHDIPAVQSDDFHNEGDQHKVEPLSDNPNDNQQNETHTEINKPRGRGRPKGSKTQSRNQVVVRRRSSRTQTLISQQDSCKIEEKYLTDKSLLLRAKKNRLTSQAGIRDDTSSMHSEDGSFQGSDSDQAAHQFSITASNTVILPCVENSNQSQVITSNMDCEGSGIVLLPPGGESSNEITPNTSTGALSAVVTGGQDQPAVLSSPAAGMTTRQVLMKLPSGKEIPVNLFIPCSQSQ